MVHPIPFPLASGRYEVGPAMRRFGQAGMGLPAEEAHFLPDELLAPTLAAKLAALRGAAPECHLTAAEVDEPGLRAALQATFRILASEQPAMASTDDDGVTLHHLGLRIAGWSAPAPRLERVGDGWPELAAILGPIHDWLGRQHGLRLLGDGLGLAVQEDLAVIRGLPAGAPEPDLLEWLHVCLPSNWAPSTKIGRSFGAVHQPVVHSERLTASQFQLVRAMIHGGPFVRYVWGLHRDGELCHNPTIHQAEPWRVGASPAEIAGQAWFRVERQTTRGFPALNRSLFTIRYWVEPLTQTAADPWRRERLASALAGMTDDELAYKGLSDVREELVAWLNEG